VGHHGEGDVARESSGKCTSVSKAKGIFESTILQQPPDASESGGSEPELSKISSRKHLARRSNRRRSSTTAIDATQPPTPKRVPRRATTTGAAPASTGRARRFLALPRGEQRNAATSIPSLGIENGEDQESPTRVLPSAIREVRSDSDSSDSSDSDDNMTSPSADISRDVPAPVSFTFPEIPFLTISKDIVENAERSSSQLRFANVEPSECRLDESQAKEEIGDAHPHQEVIIIGRKNGIHDDRTSDEYSQLSFELAQSRIRLRETRMEVDQIELDILMLQERLLILDQRKEANHVSLFA
jgi:hypothetical protein